MRDNQVESKFKELDALMERAQLLTEQLEDYIDVGRGRAILAHVKTAHRHVSMAHTKWLKRPQVGVFEL